MWQQVYGTVRQLCTHAEAIIGNLRCEYFRIAGRSMDAYGGRQYRNVTVSSKTDCESAIEQSLRRRLFYQLNFRQLDCCPVQSAIMTDSMDHNIPSDISNLDDFERGGFQ
jgi:hypothetical protein